MKRYSTEEELNCNNIFFTNKMKYLNISTLLNKEQIPYFCWDRKLTVKDIQNNLQRYSGLQKIMYTAWIMREAAFNDVWYFLSPYDVFRELSSIEKFLGRKKNFWRYILEKWHELGKI